MDSPQSKCLPHTSKENIGRCQNISIYDFLTQIVECNPTGKRGAEKNLALGARFQKLREGAYYQGRLNSQMDRGELNSQRGLDSRRLPCFSVNVLFLWQHCY